MPASSARSQTELRSPPAELHLSSWPLRDEGPAACLPLLGAVGLSAVAGYWTGSSALGVICLAALSLALWRLWLPVEYHLGPRGFVESALGRHRRVAWSQVAGYEVRRGGILLLASGEAATLRSFQGRYIPWFHSREELLGVVRFYLDR